MTQSRPGRVAPFTVHLEESLLDDLRERLARTRWPHEPAAPGWSSGTDSNYLHRLTQYWSDGFDWRAREGCLNGYPQFIADLGEVRLHFVHHKSGNPAAIPLLLIHGWPSTFAEYLPLLDELTDSSTPSSAVTFDIVLLSLPGYAFSSRPPQPVTYATVAEWSHQLMALLGYTSFGVGGDDFGAGVATYMCLQHPRRVLGLHLSHLEFRPPFGPESAPLSPAERDHLDAMNARGAGDSAFAAIQQTRPGTLAVAMSDSPRGHGRVDYRQVARVERPQRGSRRARWSRLPSDDVDAVLGDTEFRDVDPGLPRQRGARRESAAERLRYGADGGCSVS